MRKDYPEHNTHYCYKYHNSLDLEGIRTRKNLRYTAQPRSKGRWGSFAKSTQDVLSSNRWLLDNHYKKMMYTQRRKGRLSTRLK